MFIGKNMFVRFKDYILRFGYFYVHMCIKWSHASILNALGICSVKRRKEEEPIYSYKKITFSPHQHHDKGS